MDREQKKRETAGDVAGALPQLEAWTEWVVCYTWALMGLLQADGLLFLCCGGDS